MALNKAIEHGKEKRQPYRKSKRFDSSCRNHGGCPWCESNRTRKNTIRARVAQEQIDEVVKSMEDNRRQSEMEDETNVKILRCSICNSIVGRVPLTFSEEDHHTAEYRDGMFLGLMCPQCKTSIPNK